MSSTRTDNMKSGGKGKGKGKGKNNTVFVRPALPPFLARVVGPGGVRGHGGQINDVFEDERAEPEHAEGRALKSRVEMASHADAEADEGEELEAATIANIDTLDSEQREWLEQKIASASAAKRKREGISGGKGEKEPVEVGDDENENDGKHKFVKKSKPALKKEEKKSESQFTGVLSFSIDDEEDDDEY